MTSNILIYIKMSYYCDVCDKAIKLKSKCSHFKSNIHKSFDRCKLLILTIENPNINDIDVFFCLLYRT